MSDFTDQLVHGLRYLYGSEEVDEDTEDWTNYEEESDVD